MESAERQTSDTSPTSVFDNKEEIKHFLRVLGAFKYYKFHCYQRLDQAEKDFFDIPKRHQRLLPNYIHNINQLRICVAHNAEIIKLMIRDTATMFENLSYQDCRENQKPDFVTNFDMEKVRTTIKQFVRDWSADGKAEREDCYTPIIQEIEKLFPEDQYSRRDINILVPGAGLGRLAFEIAFRGFSCQGNEFSLFMLIASNFVLNNSAGVNCYTLYPWVYQFSNVKDSLDQTRPASFPDISPGDLPPDSAFSMVAGDFLEVYTAPDAWDCIATCYFIDTAHNILDYVETIYKILKPGGYWINLGPLLYHFENMTDQASIEISYDVLKRVIRDMGFQILRENTRMTSSYLQNPSSMMKYTYDCAFFVCQKPGELVHTQPSRSNESRISSSIDLPEVEQTETEAETNSSTNQDSQT